MTDFPVKVSGASRHSSALLDDFRSTRVHARVDRTLVPTWQFSPGVGPGTRLRGRPFMTLFRLRLSCRETPGTRLPSSRTSARTSSCRLPQLDSSSGKITTWLYGSPRGWCPRATAERRVRNVVLAISLPAASRWRSGPQSPDGVLEARQTREAGAANPRGWSPKNARVRALRAGGPSGEEIAERVGCRIETSGPRLHYARQQFQALAREGALIP